MSSRTLPFLLVSITALLSGCRGGDDPPPPPGSLDPDFGFQGKVTTPIGTGNDQALAVALQPDGKIIAAGVSETGGFQDLAVARYNPDGSLDTSFGTGGKVIVDFDGSHDIAYSVAVQPDGMIVVAGGGTIAGDFCTVVLRFTSTGSPDIAFDGDGTVIGDIGSARSIALQADGKIVVAGDFHTSPYTDMAVWRYNSDGSPDTSFDSDGRVTTAVGTASSEAWSVAIQPTGEIVIGGLSNNGSDPDFAVVRYNADGSLDTGFGTGGIQTTDVTGSFDWGRSLALQSDGRIILAGASDTPSGFAFVAVRYGSDGTLDPTFGVGGAVITSITSFGGEARGVVALADGKVILAGYAANASDHDLGLARYNADGSLDEDFDDDGRVTTPVGLGIDQFNAVAIAADGKIVAVGFATTGTDEDFLITRYNN